MRQLVFTSILVLFCYFCDAQPYTLQLNLQEGHSYPHKINAQTSIKQQINGQPFDMKMDIEGTMQYKVKTLQNNTYTMDVQYTKMRMTMGMPQGSLVFNSEQPSSTDIMSTILSMLTKGSFEVEITKKGEITQVNKLDELFSNIFAQFPQITQAQREQLKQQLMKAYGEEAIKGSIEMATAVFPPEPKTPGDSWNISTRLASGFEAESTTLYKLAECTDEYFLLTGNGKIHTKDKAAMIQANGMPIKYKLNGSIKSVIKLDKKTGWIIESSVRQKITGEAQIEASEQLPDGMVIPMEIDSESLIRGAR